jgi:hypothetical protein
MIQEATDDDILNSNIEKKGRNSGNEEEEEHVKKEVHESCNLISLKQ